MWATMSSDDDYSDYEDKETAPSYQLFPTQGDQLLQGMYHGENSVCDEDRSRSNLSVGEEIFEDIGDRTKNETEPFSRDKRISAQDRNQCENISGFGRMQMNMKSTETSLSHSSNASFPTTSITSTVEMNTSRYSQLLNIMKGRSRLKNVNDIQGENCFGNEDSVQKTNHPCDVDPSTGEKWSQALNDPSPREEPPGCNNQAFWSSAGGDVDYSSEVFCNKARDVGSYSRNCINDYSVQMMCNADAGNEGRKLLSFVELPSGGLIEKAAEGKLTDKNVFPVDAPQCSKAQEDFTLKEYSDCRERGLHEFRIASGIKECSIPSSVENCLFKKVKEQFNILYWRIKVNSYAQTLLAVPGEREFSSKLEVHINQLRLSTSPFDMAQKLSAFSCALQIDISLANCFLTNFISYVLSGFDMEKNLTGTCEILEYLIPCINTVINGRVEEQAINSIRNENLLQVLYNSIVKICNTETKFRENDIRNFMQYQSSNKIIKAHIVRMSPEDSQKLFQETFADTGNLSDLYIIYTWQILKIFEIEEGNMYQASVSSLSELMVESRKFISIIPAKDLKDKAWKVPFSHFGSKSSELEQSGKYKETSHPVVDMSVEWADFRFGRLYENGVVFLVNMTDWVDRLQEISQSIERLEVKKKVKFMTSLGSSYALAVQDGVHLLKGKEDVKYIRVRVVRLVGPMTCVYGIDMGSTHVCNAADLILLPASILNCAPCGRLARLPVGPAPNPALLRPSLALLVAFSQRADLAQDLCNIDIRPMASWIQVKELTQLTLDLLEAIVDAIPKTHLLPDICSVITDYLLRTTLKKTQESACTRTALSVLQSAMQTSPKIRLFLAKEGAFITLCDIGLRMGEEHAWKSVRTLVGGNKAMEKWTCLSSKVSRIHHKRNSNNWESQRHQVLPSSTALSMDTSPTVMCIAAMTVPDRNWDLEVRNTIRSRQLVHYQSHGGWRWEKEQILATDVGELHYGHMFNLQNDETHHIILDKSVPNIRMNTLLQIILGMLNTGLGGKIYIGLNQSGIIHGVKINRDQRDCFMLGFSKLVTSEIFPMVLPCDSLVQFIPVIRYGALPVMSQVSSSTPHPSESDFYVIILTVRPQPNLVYHYRGDPEPIFLREGGVTSTLRGQRLAQFITSSANMVHKLQKQVSQEKQAMLDFILSCES